MKKYASVLLLILALIVPTVTKGANQTEDRKQLLKEIREFKHKFLARELSLTKEQQQQFFPIYDQMEDETDKLQAETREMEKKVRESADPSDLEYEKATDAIFELKMKEGEIEKSYLEKFRGVLSNKQLFNLKQAERNFNRDLMNHHNRLRQKRNKNQ